MEESAVVFPVVAFVVAVVGVVLVVGVVVVGVVVVEVIVAVVRVVGFVLVVVVVVVVVCGALLPSEQEREDKIEHEHTLLQKVLRRSYTQFEVVDRL